MKPLKSHCAISSKLEKSIRGGDSVFLTGPPCSGKTTLATWVLQKNRYPFALLDCNYFKNLSKFYIDILENFNASHPVKEVHNRIPEHVLSSADFLHLFEEYYAAVSKTTKGNKLYLILDDVEVLVKYSVLEVLVGLSNLEALSLILIGNQLPIQLFTHLSDTSARRKLIDRLGIIFMTPFSGEDTLKLVMEELPTKQEDVYRAYATHVVSFLYLHETKNLMEIKSFCQDTFPKFLEFADREIEERIDQYEEGTTKQDLYDDRSSVMKLITSFCQQYKQVSRKVDIHTWHKGSSQLPICYGLGVLIISVLIAACTRPSADKINFVKLQKKGKRNLGTLDGTRREFTTERLIHIFRGLSEMLKDRPEDGEDVLEFSDLVFSDIQVLENLNIIQPTARNGLDVTKYKMTENLPASLFQRISREIKLDLQEIHGLPKLIIKEEN